MWDLFKTSKMRVFIVDALNKSPSITTELGNVEISQVGSQEKYLIS